MSTMMKQIIVERLNGVKLVPISDFERIAYLDLSSKPVTGSVWTCTISAGLWNKSEKSLLRVLRANDWLAASFLHSADERAPGCKSFSFIVASYKVPSTDVESHVALAVFETQEDAEYAMSVIEVQNLMET